MSKQMKMLVIILVVVIFAIVGAIIAKMYIEYINRPHYIPSNKRNEYIVYDADENYLVNYLDKKKNTLVVFWASWCPSCVEEIKGLDSFISKNPDIPVIVVSHDKEKDELTKFLEENNLKWFVIFDTNKIIRNKISPDTSGIPSSYLLDINGNVLKHYIGEFTQDEFKSFYTQP